jgi:hypothetical protein
MRITLLGLVFLFACGGGGRGGPDASSDGGGGGDGGEVGGPCGGLAGRRCTATEYCDYADNTCGIADGQGVCKPRPSACPLIVGAPTCGCDGKVYSGECPTYTGGTDLNANGTCVLVTGRFACGYLQCDLATQYCRRDPQPSSADTFTCIPLPACTGMPSCTCLATQPCGTDCAGDAKVGLTLTCPPKP